MQTIQITEAGVELTFAVEFHFDDDFGAPWENSDGNGVVSGWERRSKLPGELILSESRGSKRFFDFAETCKIALRDGWDAQPYNDGSETPRQQAAKAARANYEYLRGWCQGDWCYVGVEVTLLDDEGEKTDVSDSLWGVETLNDYHQTQAKEIAEELAAGMGVRWGWTEKVTKVAEWIKEGSANA